MKKTRILALLLVLMLSVGAVFAACAETADGKKLVYFCVSNLPHPFSEASVKELNSRVEELGLNWEVVVADGQGDANVQLTTIEDAIAKGADAIIWKPVTSETAATSAKTILEAGIPSINVNRNVVGADVTVLIYGENTQIGEAVAKDMIERLGGKGKVAMLEGKLGSSDSEERKKLFVEECAKYPEIEIVADQACDWNKDKAVSTTEDILMRYPDLAAIYCHSDEMAQGAVLAVESAGLTGKVLIYGVDCYKTSLDMIEEGKMTGTVIFPTSLATAVDTLAEIFENGGEYKGEPVLIDDVIIVTEENYKNYYDKALDA